MNTYKDYLKKVYVQKDVLGFEIAESIAATKDTPETAMLLKSDREIVLTVINGLEEVYREVLVFRYYQDLKLEEIAQVLGIPVGTVKSKLSTALHRLGKILKREGGIDNNGTNQ